MVAAIAVGGYIAWLGGWGGEGESAAGATGRVVIESVPEGAEVLADGRPSGYAPTTLILPVGSHVLEVRGNGETRRLFVDVESDRESSHRVTLFPTGTKGELKIDTVPQGASVSIDGRSFGVTPVTVTGVEPGQRTVVVSNDAARLERQVVIEPGASVPLAIPLSGDIDVVAPLELKVMWRGRLLGTSRSRRLALGAGQQRLELVNDEVGFREEVTVDVEAGQTIRLPVTIPDARLVVTSDEPADVALDGAPVGRTPLGSIVLSVGQHELVVSHPAIGELRYTIVARAGSNRLHVSFPKQPVSRTPPRRPRQA